jgi:3-methyl-2-oxobutanoate hydroxymethyltransferase
VVLEGVPAALAEYITGRLDIPTIGIGAGAGCDGQVLVYQDMLAIYSDMTPKFVKRFANVGTLMKQGIADYIDQTKAGVFPAKEHTYSIDMAVIESLKQKENGDSING